MNNNKRFDLDEHFRAIAYEKVAVPMNLSSSTAVKILDSPETSRNFLPMVMLLVFAINVLVSVFFGGVLFLMRPITLVEWVIIGSVYSTVNVFLYTITIINYEKIQNMLSIYSKGGV
jgi:hypothetical protein